MSHLSRRQWRLFCLAPLVALAVARVESQTPALTTISEVRWSDFGWGPYNDQNLAGRFTTQTFTLPRLSKVQDYFSAPVRCFHAAEVLAVFCGAAC
jgi:hypothetical protein